MNKIVKISFWSMVCSLFMTQAVAQFAFSGEFRPRTEYSHGYNQLAEENQKSSLFTSQRTRINFDYKASNLRTKLVLQDVRIWGGQPQLVSNEALSVSVHEAWFEYNLLPEVSLKAGRQELVYGNHRILGNVGWAQQGRSHDLFLIKYEKDFIFHGGLAYHENSERNNNFYLGPDAYKSMQFFWVNKKMEKLDINFLFLNNGIGISKDTTATGKLAEQGINYSQTFGPGINYATEKFKINSNFYVQGGKDANEKDLTAYYANVEIGTGIKENINLSFGYEMLSGTDFDETTVNHSFTPFYGTNHKFNGFMDYFYTGNHINNVGLNDLYFKVKRSSGKISLLANIHYFSTAAKISADSESYLGTEVDLGIGMKVDESLNINFGYSQMFAGPSMELLKGGVAAEMHNWIYLMITVKPLFFGSK